MWRGRTIGAYTFYYDEMRLAFVLWCPLMFLDFLRFDVSMSTVQQIVRMTGWWLLNVFDWAIFVNQTLRIFFLEIRLQISREKICYNIFFFALYFLYYQNLSTFNHYVRTFWETHIISKMSMFWNAHALLENSKVRTFWEAQKNLCIYK